MIIVFIFLYQPNGEFYQPRVQEAYAQAEKKVAADDKIKDADKPMELALIKEQIASLYKSARVLNDYTWRESGNRVSGFYTNGCIYRDEYDV